MPSLARLKEALKRNRTAKEWTEILVPWLQLLALAIAGVYAVVQYEIHVNEQKKQASIDYVTRLNSEELRGINAELSARYQRQYIRFEAKHPKFLPTDYYNFVMNDVLMFGQDKSLETNLNILVGFLDDGVTCSESKICDEKLIKSTLGDFGETTIEQYYPYLCFWGDTFYGNKPGDDKYLDRIFGFYGASPMAEGCPSYAVDIKKTKTSLGL